GEFHGQVIDLQAVELGENFVISAGVLGFAADARAGAAAEVNGQLQVGKTIHHRVEHVDGEVLGFLRVFILRADGGVDEEAQVRVVDLNDGGAGVAQKLQLLAQDGDAVADEVVAA